MKKSTISLLIILLLVVACGGEEPVPTPVPTAATNAAAEVAAPTPTTAVPATLLPPPPTIAPAPTTAAVETAVSADSSDSDSVTLLTQADFGDNRNPLTGELVSDPSVLQRRPLAVKISNAPPLYVRPQSGLNDADIIYEHTAEGSITRFTAIFYDTAPVKIGPIRSARLIDLELPAMYDAALAFSGASVGVNQRLNAADFQSRILYSAEPGYFRTGEDKPFEHTLYGDPNGFWQALDAKGQNTSPNFGTFNAFSTETPAGGQPGGYAAIDYQWETVEWRYDATNGRYWRWAADQPILDANTGEQVNVANVIIIAPFHVEDGTICEEIREDQCAHLSIQIQIWGEGSGLLLRDGQQFNVNWHRAARNDVLTFTDSNGNPFPMQIGNSWVQLVPTWYQDPVTVSE
ncbi:MAG: DUF3048 domain-containing protein [Chloroflexi bacterium]|nr:DUF3048 domain-containing protein [Chloroflexota bacterium]